MKLFKYLFVIGTLILLLPACKKKVLDDDIITEEPPFRVEGTIDGQDFSLIGGIGNVLIDPEHTVSEEGFSVFNTNFSMSNCTDCNEALTIEFIGNEVLGVEFSEILPLGFYDIVDYLPADESTFFTLDVSNTIVNQLDLIHLFGGISYSGPADGFAQEFLDSGFYNMYMDFDNSLEIQSYSYEFFVEGSENCGSMPQITIIDNVLSFHHSNDNPGLFNIMINNDDLGVISPGQEISLLNYIPGPSFILDIGITEIMLSDCFTSSEWIFAGQDGSLSNYEGDISFVSEQQNISNTALSARIHYTNSEGVDYVTEVDDVSTLNITEIEIYTEDPNGLEAYLVHITANITLVNITEPTDVINMIIEDAVIPVVNE